MLIGRPRLALAVLPEAAEAKAPCSVRTRPPGKGSARARDASYAVIASSNFSEIAPAGKDDGPERCRGRQKEHAGPDRHRRGLDNRDAMNHEGQPDREACRGVDRQGD